LKTFEKKKLFLVPFIIFLFKKEKRINNILKRLSLQIYKIKLIKLLY